MSEVPAFIYGVEQTVTFPSAVREYAKKMNQEWAGFLSDIYAAVADRHLPHHQLRSDLEPQMLDGVEIHCLGPDETTQQQFTAAYHKKLSDPDVEVPDPNLISAILALRFGDGLILLGSDALKKNWKPAVDRARRRGLPKARILKVPHHGAKNALNLTKKGTSYLDLCATEPRAKAVLFAGDSKHPHLDVFDRLRSRTDTICLSNGRKTNWIPSDPLRLGLLGGQAVQPAPICNPVVSFEMDPAGSVTTIKGFECNSGCFSQ